MKMTKEQGQLLENGCKALVVAHNEFEALEKMLRDSNDSHNQKIISKALNRLNRLVHGDTKGLLKLFEGLK